MYNRLLLLMPAAPLLAAAPVAHAVVYLTVQQAQQEMFPGQTLRPVFLNLTPEQIRAIQHASGVTVLTPQVRAWQAPDGGWFIADQVYGKHQPIAYAMALTPQGAVRKVEILSYLEAYGGAVRMPRWLAQFDGATAQTPLTFDVDIKNISGATLSCEHVTQGVRRMLATYALVLVPRAAAG